MSRECVIMYIVYLMYYSIIYHMFTNKLNRNSEHDAVRVRVCLSAFCLFVGRFRCAVAELYLSHLWFLARNASAGGEAAHEFGTRVDDDAAENTYTQTQTQCIYLSNAYEHQISLHNRRPHEINFINAGLGLMLHSRLHAYPYSSILYIQRITTTNNLYS